MELIDISTFDENMLYYVKKAQEGAVFAYPTDTIYGLGGIVTPEVIKKIDTIKQRPAGKYYSVIAPGFGWIRANFDVKEDIEHERKNLSDAHGALTLLLPLKDSDQLIGVRIIDHPFQQFVAQLGEPFITTSVNISGQQNITLLNEISQEQRKNIDFAIDAGEIMGSGSTIINYVTGEKIR